MKRRIIIALLCIVIVLFITYFKQAENMDIRQNEDFVINTVTLSDYNIDNGCVMFNVKVLITSNIQEDKYISIKGDFETDYKSGLINSQVLTGVDIETGDDTFLLPGNSQILYNVAFTAKHNSKSVRDNRLPPEIIINETISQSKEQSANNQGTVSVKTEPEKK